MKYKIEFDLPDNETILKEIKTEPIKWAVWGYNGYAFATPVKIKAPRTTQSLRSYVKEMKADAAD